MEKPTTEQAICTGNRERQRRHRQREAQKRAHAIDAQRLANERAGRMRRDPHFFGESSPGCNANTFADEFQIHREFLQALGKEDVRYGETLRAVAKRAFEAWLTGPFVCRSYGAHRFTYRHLTEPANNSIPTLASALATFYSKKSGHRRRIAPEMSLSMQQLYQDCRS
jgi:hypothetical protein